MLLAGRCGVQRQETSSLLLTAQIESVCHPGVKEATFVPRVRMKGAIPLLLLYALIEGTATLTLTKMTFLKIRRNSSFNKLSNHATCFGSNRHYQAFRYKNL